MKINKYHFTYQNIFRQCNIPQNCRTSQLVALAKAWIFSLNFQRCNPPKRPNGQNLSKHLCHDSSSGSLKSYSWWKKPCTTMEKTQRVFMEYWLLKGFWKKTTSLDSGGDYWTLALVFWQIWRVFSPSHEFRFLVWNHAILDSHFRKPGYLQPFAKTHRSWIRKRFVSLLLIEWKAWGYKWWS